MEKISQRILAVKRCIATLVHACTCRIESDCKEPPCLRMKNVVAHARTCTIVKSDGGCPSTCKQLIVLCCFHAKTCYETNCPVLFCQNIKRKRKSVEDPNLLEIRSLKFCGFGPALEKTCKKMEEGEQCLICQDFKFHVGHETKWCPSIVCKKCGKNCHSQMECMFGMENLPMPDEILLKILGYLNLGDLIACSKVSKRVKGICLDKNLSYHTYHSAISYLCLQDEKKIMTILKDKPSILETEVEVSTKTPEKTCKIFLKISRFWESWKVPSKQGLLCYEIRGNTIILEVLPLQPKRSFEVIEETDQESIRVKRLKLNKK